MRLTKEMEEAEWDKTRDIDNPLSPWVTKYKGELNLDDGENFHDRPPLEIVIRKFRTAKFTAYTAAVLFTVFFMGLWPGSMLTVDILDLNGFNIWTTSAGAGHSLQLPSSSSFRSTKRSRPS